MEIKRLRWHKVCRQPTWGLALSTTKDTYASFRETSRDVSARYGVESAADRFEELIGVKEEKSVSLALALRTEIASLDSGLGGGLISGVAEVFGEESVGKTALTGAMMRAAQNQGKLVVLVAGEYLDGPYLQMMGVDLWNVITVRGRWATPVLKSVAGLLESQDNVSLFIDSATALRPSDDYPGAWMKTMYEWVSDLPNVLRHQSNVVMVNQVRAKKSVDAKKFFAGGSDSVARKMVDMFDARLEVSRSNVDESSYTMHVNILASSFGAPARVVDLPASKTHGVDLRRDLVRAALAAGVMSRAGSAYYLDGEYLAMGEDATVRHLEKTCVRSELKNRLTANQ